MTQHQPFPFQFPPGIDRGGTEAAMAGRWYEGSLVRWVSGRLRPVGGWEKFALADFPSPIRQMHTWVDNSGIQRTAVLCETKLYLLEAETLLDITPVDGLAGPADTLLAGGYGDGLYSADAYGTPRDPVLGRKEIGHVWSLDNYGEDLLAMASTDGRLLRWKPSDPPGSLALAVPGAPVANRDFVVTAERHIIVFGADGVANRFQWCSQEDPEDWDLTSVTNTAGMYDIQPMSRILGARRTRSGIIFWTIKNVWWIRWRGMPYIYAYENVGEHNAPISSQAPVVFADNVMWPADDGFWLWDGSTIIAVTCPLFDWMTLTWDPHFARHHMGSMYLGAASEAWWFFPVFGEPENSRYVIYNFDEKWWSMGKLGRTCGVPASAEDFPLMASTTAVFRHEKGWTYYDPIELPWIQSGAIALQDGPINGTTRHLYVDTEAPTPDVLFQLFASKGRTSDAPLRTRGPKLPVAQGRVDYRLSGRDFFLKVMTAYNGAQPWSFGKGLLEIAPRGRRIGGSVARTAPAGTATGFQLAAPRSAGG